MAGKARCMFAQPSGDETGQKAEVPGLRCHDLGQKSKRAISWNIAGSGFAQQRKIGDHRGDQPKAKSHKILHRILFFDEKQNATRLHCGAISKAGSGFEEGVRIWVRIGQILPPFKSPFNRLCCGPQHCRQSRRALARMRPSSGPFRASRWAGRTGLRQACQPLNLTRNWWFPPHW